MPAGTGGGVWGGVWGSVGAIVLLAAHHGGEAGGHGDLRFPALADTGGILGRDPAAVLDRFALAEQEGEFLAGGLGRGQPLQRAGVGGGLVVDDEVAGGADLDGQRGAQFRIDRADLPRQRLAMAIVDRGDVEALVVEDDGIDPGPGIDIERGGAGDAFARHIDIEVERDMGDPGLKRLGEAVRIDRVGGIEDRRDVACAGGGRGGGVALGQGALLAGGKHERGDGK